MRKLFPVLLLALAAPAALAIPVRYDFTVTLNGGGGTVPTGTPNGSGYVIFDSDLAIGGVPNGVVGTNNVPLATLDLSFDWMGMHWDETTATLGYLYLGPTGEINGWSLDGYPSAGCGWQCVTWGTSDFNILATSGGGGGALLTQSGVNGYAAGVVSWSVGQVSVPEPGTLGLMALGLAGVALRRRRKAI